MRISRWRSFPSTPRAAMHLQPWIAPGHPCDYGLPIGIDMRTRQVVLFDPYYMMLSGVTFSTVYEIIGQVKYGKSTFEKILAMRFLGRWARHNGEISKMRIQLSTSKTEAGESEIKPLIDHYEGEMIYLRDESINAFDPYFGTRAVELLDTAVGLAESGADNHRLGADNFKALALQVGLHVILKREGVQPAAGQEGLSSQMLEAVTRTLRKADVIDYYASTNNLILDDYADALVDRPDLRERLNVSLFEPVIDELDFTRDAAVVASNIGRVHSGDFGGMFGGHKPFTDVQRGRLVGFEWGGVPDRARTLLQALIWKGLRIASEPGGDTSIVPHARFGDEAARSMENLMSVRARADYVRTSRAHQTFDLQAAQYYSQVTRVGDADTEIRNHARNIQKGIAGRFIFRLPPDDEYGEQLAREGASDYDIQRMYNLPVGHCAFVVPGRKAVFMAVLPTSVEEPLIQTNAALESMTTPPPAPFETQLQQHAALYGVTQLGDQED